MKLIPLLKLVLVFYESELMRNVFYGDTLRPHLTTFTEILSILSLFTTYRPLVI